MDKVVKDCFSTSKINSELDIHIKELNKTLKATEVSETLKSHVALNHIKHSLHFLDKRGFGIWSEQAGESIHKEFLKFWARYKINLLSDPSYSKRLKKAVVEFSSQHI